MDTAMPHSENDLQTEENRFPSISGQAFAAARAAVLASGQSVLQAENGRIYRVSPDGKKELVKEIEPPVRMQSGATFLIR